MIKIARRPKSNHECTFKFERVVFPQNSVFNTTYNICYILWALWFPHLLIIFLQNQQSLHLTKPTQFCKFNSVISRDINLVKRYVLHISKVCIFNGGWFFPQNSVWKLSEVVSLNIYSTNYKCGYIKVGRYDKKCVKKKVLCLYSMSKFPSKSSRKAY